MWAKRRRTFRQPPSTATARIWVQNGLLLYAYCCTFRSNERDLRNAQVVDLHKCVGVTGFEPATSSSRSRPAHGCGGALSTRGVHRRPRRSRAFRGDCYSDSHSVFRPLAQRPRTPTASGGTVVAGWSRGCRRLEPAGNAMGAYACALRRTAAQLPTPSANCGMELAGRPSGRRSRQDR